MIDGNCRSNHNQLIAQQNRSLCIKAAGVVLTWVLTALVIIGTFYVSHLAKSHVGSHAGSHAGTSTSGGGGYQIMATVGCLVAAGGTIASVAGLYWFFHLLKGTTQEQEALAKILLKQT